jgi:hypothetical protein
MAALKASELAGLLERFSALLGACKGDVATVRGLQDLAALLRAYEAATLGSFLKAVERVTPRKVTSEEFALAGSTVPALAALREFLTDLAKKDLLKGLDSLIKILRASEKTSIEAIRVALKSSESASQANQKSGAGPMNEALINDYFKRLEAALGDDDAFMPLLEELRRDARVGQPEAVEIATRFFGHTPSKTTRPKALSRIRERHDKLMSFKRNPSTAGRSAA